MRAFLLCLLAAPALAQDGCPAAADLARGIGVDFDTGRRDVFRAGDRPGVVVLERAEADGSRYRIELAQGLHQLTWHFVGDKRTVAYDYGHPPEALPVPLPGGRWTTDVTDPDPDLPLVLTQAYGEPGHLVIGGCTFEAIEVLAVWHSPIYRPDPVLAAERSQYLPELGFAVEVELQIANQPLEGRVPTAIRAVE